MSFLPQFHFKHVCDRNEATALHHVTTKPPSGTRLMAKVNICFTSAFVSLGCGESDGKGEPGVRYSRTYSFFSFFLEKCFHCKGYRYKM